MSAYYNEIDPQASDWLHRLIKKGLIADGEVDERSIEDVTDEDLRGSKASWCAGYGLSDRAFLHSWRMANY